MLASSTATSFPSDHTRDSKQSPPPSSSSSSSSSSIPLTTSSNSYPPALQPSPSPTSSPPIHPSHSGKFTIRLTTFHSIPNNLVLTLCDHLWRQYQLLSATWGISVLQPWEQLLTFILLSSLLALSTLAVLNFPSYILYSAQKFTHYAFAPNSLHFASSQLNTLPATAPVEQEEGMTNVELDFCRQLIAKSFNTTQLATAELSRGMRGLVDKR